jgi:hypothetical protein
LNADRAYISEFSESSEVEICKLLGLPIKATSRNFSSVFRPGGIRLDWLKDQYNGGGSSGPSTTDLAVLALNNRDELRERLLEISALTSSLGACNFLTASEKFSDLLLQHLETQDSNFVPDQRILSTLHECVTEGRLETLADTLEAQILESNISN